MSGVRNITAAGEMGELTHASNPGSDARSYQQDSPWECERSRWLTSSRRHPNLHGKCAREQDIMQDSAAVVFLLLLLVIGVTGWIVSRL